MCYESIGLGLGIGRHSKSNDSESDRGQKILIGTSLVVIKLLSRTVDIPFPSAACYTFVQHGRLAFFFVSEAAAGYRSRRWLTCCCLWQLWEFRSRGRFSRRRQRLGLVSRWRLISRLDNSWLDDSRLDDSRLAQRLLLNKPATQSGTK